jgi:hypothetical protein
MNDAAPVQASRPPRNQTNKPVPAEGTWVETCDGTEKMPEPICRLMTSARPLVKVSEARECLGGDGDRDRDSVLELIESGSSPAESA